MIETVRISEKGKTQLITLKRRTGIQNWNVLCRWAFCISLKEQKEKIEVALTNKPLKTDA